MQNLGAGPSEKWRYDVIAFSQPWYDLFNEDVLTKQLCEYQKDGSLLELVCTDSFFYLKGRGQNRRQKVFDRLYVCAGGLTS